MYYLYDREQTWYWIGLETKRTKFTDYSINKYQPNFKLGKRKSKTKIDELRN